MSNRRRAATALASSSILVAGILTAIAMMSTQAKERVLKQDLFALKIAIDEYLYDKNRVLGSLQDLLEDGYLRDIPIDPMTHSNRTWRVTQDGMGRVHVTSGSDKKDADGKRYSDW
jgi:general secretion pathway protein G